MRQKRVADGYRNISLAGQSFKISGIKPREDVELHFVPDEINNQVEIRFWASGKLVNNVNLPIATLEKTVHF